MPKIAIGCDHAAVELKNTVIEHLSGHTIIDCGTYSRDSVDYPDHAKLVAQKIVSGEADFGILICGTGIGMEIAANKVKGIRAANCVNTTMAHYSRNHNDANILCIGARIVGQTLALEIVDAFIASPFEGGRHQKRVDKIKSLEE
jgi:ribose 5-phosphate isomerase B